MSDFKNFIMSFHESLLQHNEELIAQLRSHPVAQKGSIVFGVLLVLIDAFFIIPLFSYGRIGVSTFIAALLVGLWFIVRAVNASRNSRFIMTNQRIIDFNQQGVFNHEVSELAYSEIARIFYKISGMFNKLFCCGDIIIQTTHNDFTLVLRGVREPAAAQRLIQSVWRVYE